MALSNINFNPYDPNYDKNFLKDLENEFIISDTSDALSHLAHKVTFDTSISWSTYLKPFFENHRTYLINLIKLYKDTYKDDNEIDNFALTNMIVLLASEGLINIDFISPPMIKEMSEDARYLLLSFISSINLEKAIYLDKDYVNENFSSFKFSQEVPLHEILLNTGEAQYFNIITNWIETEDINMYVIQEIIKLLRKREHPKVIIMDFIEKCYKSGNQNLVEFALETFEFNTVRNVFNEHWKSTFLERLYKYISAYWESYESEFLEMSKHQLNKFKFQLHSRMSITARRSIDRLNHEDKIYIYKKVNETYKNKLVEEFSVLNIEEHSSWDVEDYAFSILSKYSQLYPTDEGVDVKKLAKDLGIIIDMSDMKTELFDACLLRDSFLQMPIIFINTYNKSIGRVNFSIAHEIAHAILPNHLSDSFFCYLDDITETSKIIMDKALETEANNFASKILLPDRNFRDDILNRDFTIENIEILSEKYKTSLTHVAVKWVELSRLKIAVVLSTDRIIDWWKYAEEFPYIYHQIYQIADVRSSVSYVLNQSDETIVLNSYSNLWFNEDEDQYSIIEESKIIFDEEKKVLTLIQIDE